jgi:uncharacterized protein YndB with AHSA1/START domain
VGTTQIVAEPGTLQIIIEREFDAPRELVYRAYTDPALLVQWLGPRSLTMQIDYMDVRDGGSYRFIHTDAAGNEYGFRGVFHGEPTMDRTIRTFEYEGWPGHVSLETLTLEDRGGKTLVRTNSVFQSLEDRDGMVQSDMESGVNDGFERLDELLATLR